MKLFILFLFCCFGGLTYCAGIPTHGGDTSESEPSVTIESTADKVSDDNFEEEDAADQLIGEEEESQGSGSLLLPQESTELQQDEPAMLGDINRETLLPRNHTLKVSRRVGESLDLVCGFDLGKVNGSAITTLRWLVYEKDGQSKEITALHDRIHVSSLADIKTLGILRLTINNIQKDDATTYVCNTTTYIDQLESQPQLLVVHLSVN